MMDKIMELLNKVIAALQGILEKLGLWETVSNLLA